MNSKVILISGSLKLSGSATWILNLHKGFRQLGVDVIHIITSDSSLHDTPDDFRVFYTGAVDKTLQVKILRALRAHKWLPHYYDKIVDGLYNKRVSAILASLGWHPPVDVIIKDFTAYLPSVLNQYPVIPTIHQQLSINWQSTKLRSKAMQSAKCFVSVSEAVKKDAHNLGIEVQQVIHNPIDIESVKQKSKEFVVPAMLDNYIVFVGSVNANKGIFQLLDAFRLLDSQYKLCYVGSGKDLEQLKIKAKEYQLEERVMFAGFQSNPYPYISSARLLVLPTQSDVMGESMGYVAVEATILNVPILVTDFKGVDEFYEQEAIVCQEPRDGFVERLADAINASLEGRRSGRMRQDVLAGMRPDVVARKFLAVANGINE